MGHLGEHHFTNDALIALQERVELRELDVSDWSVLHEVVGDYRVVREELKSKKLSIKRLQQIIWGRKRTEKLKNLGCAGAAGSPTADESSTVPPAGPEIPQEDPTQEPANAAVDDGKPESKPKRKGHGRNGTSAFPGAKKTHSALDIQNGTQCPHCDLGRLYHADPSREVYVHASAPVQTTVLERERKRCNRCRKSVTAPIPPEFIAQPKYDPSVPSVIAALHYGAGMTFYALEKLQKSVGQPLPAATQYELLAQRASAGLPVLNALIQYAAQGELFHNDDTPMKILNSVCKPPKGTPATAKSGEGASERSIKTTNILSSGANRHTVSLFLTNDKHAGRNIETVLGQRATELPAPMQMCDALAENTSSEFATILANCNAHARRKFVEIEDEFPEACADVLKVFRTIYNNDDEAKKLSPDERLALHQAKSKAPMAALHERINAQLATKQVEPNSNLGGAYKYLLNHWSKLTLFLRKAGAPLDNNVCERALKMAIKHRKNSLFYKTSRGAKTGDFYMSMLHTCALNNIDGSAYLTAIDRYEFHAVNKPEAWLPWNYTAAIAALGVDTEAKIRAA